MSAKRDYSAEEIDLALAVFAIEGGRQRPVERHLRAAKLKVPIGTLRKWAYDTHHERYEQIAVEVEKQVQVQMADTYQRLARTSAELSEDVLARIKSSLERKDAELAEVNQRIEDCEDQLRELNVAIDAGQRRLAESLELPDADALIEEILGDPGEIELDKVLVAQQNSLYKRRDSIVNETQGLWKRRVALEVDFKDLAKILHESGVMGGIATEKLQLLTGGATERVEHNFPELQRALEAKGIRLVVGQGQGSPKLPPKPVPALPAGGDGG